MNSKKKISKEASLLINNALESIKKMDLPNHIVINHEKRLKKTYIAFGEKGIQAYLAHILLKSNNINQDKIIGSLLEDFDLDDFDLESK
jgi:hypothetical protein